MEDYDVIEHSDTALGPEVVARIRDWLQPTDYTAESGEYYRHLSSQAPGTGLWLCQTDEYKKWHGSPDHGSLWIKGVPGAGKSVMAASIIRHLETTENCPVLFFFFRNIVAANYSPRALLQDWLAQLLPFSPKLQLALQSQLNTDLAIISNNDLFDHFLSGISCVPRLYCVADALDEMNTDSRPFLDKFNRLATHRPGSLKLLLTSRPKQYLQSALRDTSIVHISLQRHLVDVDIVSYLNCRLEKLSLMNNAVGKNQLVDLVAKRSGGLFLYAKLTMDQMEEALSRQDQVDICALEASLPIGLEETYANLLQKHRQESQVDLEFQVFVLETITHASRPLRLTELASLAGCLSTTNESLTHWKQLISTCCGPLIQVLENETLQVIHHSFTEFLRGDGRNSPSGTEPSSAFPVINSTIAHKNVALRCLGYVQSLPLPSVKQRRSYREQSDDRRNVCLLYPFFDYAMENWVYHASRYDTRDHGFFHTILCFLAPDNLAFRQWTGPPWYWDTDNPSEGIPTALHVAAHAGMYEFCLWLINEQRVSVSSIASDRRTPLHRAAEKGHGKVASLLIQYGSDPNPEDIYGLKPIHLAARYNHADVVSTLLQAGVEPDTPTTNEDDEHPDYYDAGRDLRENRPGECAIYYASRYGHLETLEALIPYCAPSALEKMLCECCRFDRTEAAAAVLAHLSIPVDASYSGATALYFACGNTNTDLVQALIDHGADSKALSVLASLATYYGGPAVEEVYEDADEGAEVVFQSYWYLDAKQAPLHRLVQSWNYNNDAACQVILRILLDAGADMEQLNDDGVTALLLAASFSCRFSFSSSIVPCVPALRALLASGANVKATCPNGNKALHYALGQSQENLEAMRVLLEHEEGQQERRSLDSLHRLGKVGSSDSADSEALSCRFIEYFVRGGLDPGYEFYKGKTMLEAAMYQNPGLFQTLFSLCKDESLKQRCWFALPGEWPSRESCIQYLKIMVAQGMDPNITPEGGRPLYLHFYRYDDLLQALELAGAKASVVDANGNNVLHLLCKLGRVKRSQLEHFIARGANPLATTLEGDTLLHLVATWYGGWGDQPDLVQWLISLGISADATNTSGQTPLHVHLQHGKNRQEDGHLFIHTEFFFFDAVGSVSLEIPDKNGFTALHLACTKSESDLAILLAAGASLFSRTADGQNALHLACRARKADVVSRVLGLLGDESSNTDGVFNMINKQDNGGRTPLHYACVSGEVETVDILLRSGANVNVEDLHGHTPLHLCAQFRTEPALWDLSGYKRDPDLGGVDDFYFPAMNIIVKMLLDAGADAQGCASRETAAPLQMAIDIGCTEFIDAFYAQQDISVKSGRTLSSDGLSRETARVDVASPLLNQRLDKYLDGSVKPVLELLLDNPNQYLQLLTPDDAASLINHGFSNNRHDGRYYQVLLEMMQSSEYLLLARQVSGLIHYYSSPDNLRLYLQTVRSQSTTNSWMWTWVGRYFGTRALTPLQIICEAQRPSMVLLRYLLGTLQVDANTRCIMVDRKKEKFISGGTALHRLAVVDFRWKLDAIRYLLATGADINALNETGESPLHVAACGGVKDYHRHGPDRFSDNRSLDAVRILLDHGADPDLLDEKGLAAIHKACMHFDQSTGRDIIQELLSKGASALVGVRSPLFEAVRYHNVPAFEVLLEHGLDVNTVYDEGPIIFPQNGKPIDETKPRRRCLLWFMAIVSCWPLARSPATLSMVRIMVEHGADLYLPLNDEETVCHYLFEFAKREIVETLLQEPCVSRIDFNRPGQSGQTILMAACRRAIEWRPHDLKDGSKPAWLPLQTLRLNLGIKPDATAVDNAGQTSLHHLLQNKASTEDEILHFMRDERVASTLLTKDNDGFSPLHYALKLLRPRVCEFLCDKGADILEPDPSGSFTLHHIAAQCVQTARSFADPTDGARDWNPIPHSTTYFDDCLALWERCLKEGASINAPDRDGNTPLHVFLVSPDAWTPCKYPGDEHEYDPVACHLKRYKQLFPPESGVDIWASNREGETVLHRIAGHCVGRRADILLARHSGRPSDVKHIPHDKQLFEAFLKMGADPLKEDVKGRSALDVAIAWGKKYILDLVALDGGS